MTTLDFCALRLEPGGESPGDCGLVFLVREWTDFVAKNLDDVITGGCFDRLAVIANFLRNMPQL